MAVVAHSDRWLTQPIFTLFAAVAARQPDAIAIDDGNIRLSYAEVAERVIALGAVIAARTQPGALVALVLPQCAAQPVAVLAVLAAGRVCLPLDTHAPAAHNAAILANSRAQAVLGANMDAAAADLAEILVGPDGAPVAGGASGWQPCPAAADAPAWVIYTSGSTGVPKGIVLSQMAMTHQVLRDIDSCGLTATDRYIAPLSPATISPLRRLCAALTTGGTLHVLDMHVAGLGGLLARLRDQRITIAAIFPSLLRAMVGLAGARDACRSLRVLRVGGEALDWAQVAALRAMLPADCTILFTYGSTEISPVLEHPIGAGPHPAAAYPTIGPVPGGWPMPGCELRLLGPDGAPMAPGEAGEVVIRSRFAAMGHWVTGACVPGPFTPDPDAPGWTVFHTGDVMCVGADGGYVFLGRVDRQVKIRGHRIEPAETEAFLRRQGGVVDAAVIAHGPADAAILLAFVVLDAGAVAATLLDALRAAMRADLAPPQRPSRVLAINQIPYLTSFKPDFAALQRRAAAAGYSPKPSSR